MGGLGSGGHNRKGWGTVKGVRRLDAASLNRSEIPAGDWRGHVTWPGEAGNSASIEIHGSCDYVRLLFRYRQNGGP
jgi:hypothetical protein